jgi:hypothetical protein
MALNLQHKEWRASGRLFDLLDEQNQPTGQVVSRTKVGEQCIHDGVDWQPYIHDGYEIRYGADDNRIELAADKNILKVADNKLCESMKLFVQREIAGEWVNQPHGLPTRSVLENKRFKDKQLVDEDGYVIGWLEFPDAQYDLQIGLQSGRSSQGVFGFRFRAPISANVRMQLVKDGIQKRPGGAELIHWGGGPNNKEDRIVGVRYKDFVWRWTWKEAEFRSINIENSTEYPGTWKATITFGPIAYTADTWIEVLPDTWGYTENVDDLFEYDGTTYDDAGGVLYVGFVDYNPINVGWIWQNVDAEGTIDNAYVRVSNLTETGVQGSARNDFLYAVNSTSPSWGNPNTIPKHATPNVRWDDTTGMGTGTQVSPDIAGLIQERVDDDHVSGTSELAIVWLDNDAGYGSFQSSITSGEGGTGGELTVVYHLAVPDDLSIDASQPVYLSESIQGQLSVAGINVFESVDLSESVAIADLLLDLEINLIQQIGLNESAQWFLNLGAITTEETINITENIFPAMNLGEISINEVLGLAESLTSGVPLGLLKSDNITLVEFLVLLENIATSAFEEITVTEYLTILKDIGLSEFENITVNELVSAILASDMEINAFDAVSVVEFVQILKDIGIDTAQIINVSEVVSAVLLLAGISKADGLSVNEGVDLLLSLAGIDTAQQINVIETVVSILRLAGVSVAENLTVTEYLNVLATSDWAISDKYESVSVVEAVTLLFSFLPLSVSESLTVAESIQALLATTGISVSDSVDLTEAVTLLLTLGLVSASESIAVSEAITALLEAAGADVSENISISEYVLSILDVTGINITQPVTISEYVYVTMVTVAGLMRVAFSVLKPSAAFSVAKPKITFN